LLISTFTNNQVVSLPQTIHFSNTPDGQKEKEKTRQIYAKHRNLTIIGRDPRSGEIAQEMFPHAKTFSMPDFVLSLPSKHSPTKNNPPKILLCLRLDNESALTEAQRIEIEKMIPYECTRYDTTLANPIPVGQRETILENTLNLFLEHDLVITDRYHGLIFTVLCQKPCVVLPTVDHKLTSAIFWFKNIPSIKFANNIQEIPNLVEENLKAKIGQYPDWNVDYFDKIPQLIE
jgi:pyruvyl transferase EpsI